MKKLLCLTGALALSAIAEPGPWFVGIGGGPRILDGSITGTMTTTPAGVPGAATSTAALDQRWSDATGFGGSLSFGRTFSVNDLTFFVNFLSGIEGTRQLYKNDIVVKDPATNVRIDTIQKMSFGRTKYMGLTMGYRHTITPDFSVDLRCSVLSNTLVFKYQTDVGTNGQLMSTSKDVTTLSPSTAAWWKLSDRFSVGLVYNYLPGLNFNVGNLAAQAPDTGSANVKASTHSFNLGLSYKI